MNIQIENEMAPPFSPFLEHQFVHSVLHMTNISLFDDLSDIDEKISNSHFAVQERNNLKKPN